jgi:hypothetical protein
MDHKIIKDYLEDGMMWANKETTPFVVIDNIQSVLDCTVNKLDYINVRYSVFFKDKNGDVFPYMKNITATIFNQSLIPYMRDNKLKEILND